MDTNHTLELIDIADDLLIINKKTIDTLMGLENASDCIALYVFYYKTAKWQKTNQIKASDIYVMKCLGWGKQRLVRTKDVLRENGLIEVVHRRDGEGKIIGWYVKLSYVVSKKILEGKEVTIQRYQSPPVDSATCGEQNTSALKLNNKCLKTESKILSNADCDAEFESLWELYPNKRGKQVAKKHYRRHRKSGTSYEEVEKGIKAYVGYITANKVQEQYVKYGSTFFSQKSWEDDWSVGSSASNQTFDDGLDSIFGGE